VFNSFQTKLTVFFTALFLLLQGAAFFTVRESIVQNIFDQSRDQLVAANRVFASRIQATVNALGRLSLLYYDNQSFDCAFDGFQYAWDTYFTSAGYENELPGGIELISQFMIDNTSMGTRPLLGSKVDKDYWSVFALLSKRFGKHRFSFRYDHFEVADDDLTPDDLNQENGDAWTAAYVLRSFRKQRLTLEVLHADSKRPEREFLNLPVRAKETTIQASYRFFL
jgi:hypothetical protein